VNAASIELQPPCPGERPWPRTRWWLLIALVFAAHLGLILAFADHRPMVPRRAAPGPVLRLATDSGDLLALFDPTLFARPHRRGFAGAAWLEIQPVEFLPFEWTEPPRWIPLPTGQLGAAFARFMQTNGFTAFQRGSKPPPEMTIPELAPEPAFATESMLRIEGDLERRRLLNPPELGSWASAELLTRSVVQVLVDASGRVVSVALLPPGSGSPEADQHALELAKAARFEPAPGSGLGVTASPAAGLSMGKMLFEWHTVPLAATNAPAAAP